MVGSAGIPGHEALERLKTSHVAWAAAFVRSHPSEGGEPTSPFPSSRPHRPLSPTSPPGDPRSGLLRRISDQSGQIFLMDRSFPKKSGLYLTMTKPPSYIPTAAGSTEGEDRWLIPRYHDGMNLRNSRIGPVRDLRFGSPIFPPILTQSERLNPIPFVK
jgi:hypothetical protein